MAPAMSAAMSAGSQLERERWMRARQAARPRKAPPVRTHARYDYCGACRDCRELDAFLASGDQRRMPWPRPDERGGPQSSWRGIVEHLQKFGAPLITPGPAWRKRAGQELGERRAFEWEASQL